MCACRRRPSRKGRCGKRAPRRAVFFLSPSVTPQAMLIAVAAALAAFLFLSLVVERSYALKF